ncbi:uncharacterized protein [Spinacia oleracea]|uniref:ABC-2 type transporter domain-containing protein n=1 Tax=Spinacia oleracea TaxID=3562 RepID=A0ABM3R433_SPIOL|nr:uncharacterized protein LOC130465588 [Spinacia oleracea]
MVWAFWLFEAFLRWLTSSIVEQFLNLIVLYILGILSGFYFMLFSDFDLTCIVVDLSAILAAIVTALKSDQSPTYSQITWMSFTDLRNTWSDFPRQYTEEYEQCIETILSANKGRFFKSAGDIVEVRFAQTVMVVTCEWAWWLRQHICIRESMFYQWSNQWIAL